jgi:hypothetical protein
MPGKFDSPIYPAPIAFEEAHFEAAYFPTAAASAVAVRLVGAVAPVAPEAVFAVALTAAVEVSADTWRVHPLNAYSAFFGFSLPHDEVVRQKARKWVVPKYWLSR